jgi:putative addiction module component (TIGR02574 family)
MGKPAFDISKLTADEKLDLIDDLWRSLDPEDLPLSPEVRAELDRRLDRFDRDGSVGVAWEDVLAEMTPDDS